MENNLQQMLWIKNNFVNYLIESSIKNTLLNIVSFNHYCNCYEKHASLS